MSNRELFDQDKNLYVYKASAGSGKTHRLTAEYLSMLFSEPFAYRHILAVTFTNKATDEMKNRIISELAKLAKNEKSDYVVRLTKEYELTELQVRERARKVLTQILHDYSAFSVSTIDRFFQQTMRSFTREIGLSGGYNVELDTSSVLAKAIDTLLFDLERKDNKMLLDWLVKFSEEKIESGKTWNIRDDIQSLSSEIFKENYRVDSGKVQENISDKNLMSKYRNMLYEMIAIFENTTQQLGERGLNIMERYELHPDDFKGGSRSPFLTFVKWANRENNVPTKTFLSLADDIKNWYTAKTPTDIKNKIEEAFFELNACVLDVISHFENSITYQTAKEINRYFFTLGILGDVDKKIKEYTAEHNMMLISDTTELLNNIIEGNESPFIYEKIGTRISHYMIDEFQDTSSMQWQNFRPLIKDSLASGNNNFIVGDVKQSIYRWRNSDWKLLDSQLDIDFSSENILHETLDTNWRSAYNIVNFNNAIFTLGSDKLQEVYNSNFIENNDDDTHPYLHKIKDAYNDLFQKIPAKHKDCEGHVKVEFVDADEEAGWQENALDQMVVEIEDLQDRGYQLQDIAILVRTKKEGAAVAQKLLVYKNKATDSRYRYDIISDEALYISNSKSVRLITSLLEYLQNPTNESLKALAVYEYFRNDNKLNAEDALAKLFSENEMLPDEIVYKLSIIRQLALYEMVESLFEMFQDTLSDEDQIYVQAFLDLVLDYSIRSSSDLDAFLRWWKESGVNKTIYTPDGQDAIRIMTIHKSKGLGFEAVIIPFCNWEIDHKLETILWCRPTVEPFNQLHLVPVRYSKYLSDTIFWDAYYEEKLHAFIDNINVLYVAFTRAKNDLIILAPALKRKEVNNISSLLWNCIVDSADLSEVFEEEKILEMGASFKQLSKKKGSLAEEIMIDKLPNISFDDRLKLQLSNKYFFTDTGKRDYGTLMHEIVSSIETVDDVEPIIQKYFIEGEIDRVQKEDLTEMLHLFLKNKMVQDWYSGKYKVLNEVQILLGKGKFVRPDRVMIFEESAIVVDYKFGEREEARYLKQVKGYMSEIENIGYNNVKGYICYVSLGKIVEV